jgi:hypothetical protein
LQAVLKAQAPKIQHKEDSRPIPCYKRTDSSDPQIKFIEVGFIQWYLRERIQEWIAFGGEGFHKTGLHNARRTGNSAFLRDFYWDLWKDIKNLREKLSKLKSVQLTSRHCGRSTKQLRAFEIGFHTVKLNTYSCLVCIYCTDLSPEPSTR